MNDTELMDFISANEAWLTYAIESQGTNRAWRCHVAAQHYPTPDARERAARMGYGLTAREAVVACMESAPDLSGTVPSCSGVEG